MTTTKAEAQCAHRWLRHEMTMTRTCQECGLHISERTWHLDHELSEREALRPKPELRPYFALDEESLCFIDAHGVSPDVLPIRHLQAEHHREAERRLRAALGRVCE